MTWFYDVLAVLGRPALTILQARVSGAALVGHVTGGLCVWLVVYPTAALYVVSACPCGFGLRGWHRAEQTAVGTVRERACLGARS